jgi:hypothetical protein
MADDHKAKLMAHVANIPMEPGGLASGPAHTKGNNNADFTRLAGMSHDSLLADWAVNKPTTCCNSFISSCAAAMGYTGAADIAVSSFDIAELLATRGLSHVWVLPDSGAEPECGDIFRLLGDQPDHNGVRKNHMGVVLEVNGGSWTTVEGGQGGKTTGFDKICKKRYSGSPGDLRGWASMKALLGVNKPLPYWLGGWWMVEQEPYDTWYYYFGTGGLVGCTMNRPHSALAPPANARFVGTHHEMVMFKRKIIWNNSDVDEELTFVIDTNPDRNNRKDKLVGKTKSGQKLTGVRLK